jgi:hypothetical protein
LNGVPFREGQHFSQRGTTGYAIPPVEFNEVWVTIPIWKQILFWLSLGLIVVLIGLLLSPEMRKRLFLVLIRIGFTVWAFYLLFKRGLLNFNLSGGGVPAPNQDATVPMPAFAPPQVSPTFSYMISFVVALIWLAVLWILYRGWQRYLSLNNGKPLGAIAKIARSSLDELNAGRNSNDVIINCYLRMSDVVSDKRHLHRQVAMTPHEFALHLEQAGLPGDAVTRLTRLFEGVRYGARKSGPQDINEAVSCLKTILHYCGEPI